MREGLLNTQAGPRARQDDAPSPVEQLLDVAILELPLFPEVGLVDDDDEGQVLTLQVGPELESGVERCESGAVDDQDVGLHVLRGVLRRGRSPVSGKIPQPQLDALPAEVRYFSGKMPWR